MLATTKTTGPCNELYVGLCTSSIGVEEELPFRMNDGLLNFDSPTAHVKMQVQLESDTPSPSTNHHYHPDVSKGDHRCSYDTTSPSCMGEYYAALKLGANGDAHLLSADASDSPGVVSVYGTPWTSPASTPTTTLRGLFKASIVVPLADATSCNHLHLLPGQ